MIFASNSDSLWDSSPRRLCSVDVSSSFFTDCYEVKGERERMQALAGLGWARCLAASESRGPTKSRTEGADRGAHRHLLSFFGLGFLPALYGSWAAGRAFRRPRW